MSEVDRRVDALIVSLSVGLIAPGWRLAHPISIALELNTDGEYVANDDLFQVYGAGETPDAARQDYIASLIEYYQIIQESAEENAPSKALFRKLHSYLQPV